MLRVERLKAEDVETLGRALSIGEKMEAEDFSRSVFFGDELILCGGVALYWTGRGEAWAMVSPKAKKHALSLTKAVKKFIEECPVSRIEAAAQWNQKRDCKWIEAIGFQKTHFAAKYLPGGKDAQVYARVNLDG